MSARERPRSRWEVETPPRDRGRRIGASPALVPSATLAALVVVLTTLVAVRAASGLLREWSLAIAAFLAVAGCWLGAVGVAHLAASVAARRSGTRR